MLLHFKPETSLRLSTNARLMCLSLPDSGRGSGKDSREEGSLGPQDGRGALKASWEIRLKNLTHTLSYNLGLAARILPRVRQSEVPPRPHAGHKSRVQAPGF